MLRLPNNLEIQYQSYNRGVMVREIRKLALLIDTIYIPDSKSSDALRDSDNRLNILLRCLIKLRLSIDTSFNKLKVIIKFCGQVSNAWQKRTSAQALMVAFRLSKVSWVTSLYLSDRCKFALCLRVDHPRKRKKLKGRDKKRLQK